MKLTIPTRGLERALSVVARAAAKSNPSNPLLQAVLFEAANDALQISATDLELSASLRCAAGVEEDGSLAVGARMLHDLVRSLKDGELELSTGNGGALLTQGINRYSMRAYVADDYPKIPDFPREGSFAVPADRFAAQAAKVLPSASRDESRPILAGVSLSFEGGSCKMVATDSYRMAVAETGMEGAPEEKREAVVPATSLSEAAKLAGRCETLLIAIVSNTAFFKGGGVTLSSRLVEGSYPDYVKILPETFGGEFVLETKPLADTLRRVGLFASHQNPPAPVKLAFSTGEGSLEGGTLTISCESAETGAATEKIGTRVESDFATAFNGGFLLDGLKTCGTERVRLKVNEPLKPAVISPEGEDGQERGSLTYLVMPVRDPKAAS